jgi:F-type H+-transporting ATPase subunit c
MTGDIAQMGAYIGAGLATIGMGGADIGVGLIVGKFLKASTAVKDANNQQGNMFVGIAFAEALGIFAFLVALLLMFAV